MVLPLLARFNAFYNHHYEANPIRTLVIANGGLTTLSDVFAQWFAPGKNADGTTQPYDYTRTARFAVFGMGMGPVIGKWLAFLERTFPMAKGVSTAQRVATDVKRVATDQIVMAPIGLGIFTGSMGVMEGKSVPEIKDKFRKVYKIALITNWKVWPAIQAINFAFVPLPYRLPFQQTCGIAWSAYLSLLNAKQERIK